LVIASGGLGKRDYFVKKFHVTEDWCEKLLYKKALNREKRNLVPHTITYDFASIITRKKIGIAWRRG